MSATAVAVAAGICILGSGCYKREMLLLPAANATCCRFYLCYCPTLLLILATAVICCFCFSFCHFPRLLDASADISTRCLCCHNLQVLVVAVVVGAMLVVPGLALVLALALQLLRRQSLACGMER